MSLNPKQGIFIGFILIIGSVDKRKSRLLDERNLVLHAGTQVRKYDEGNGDALSLARNDSLYFPVFQNLKVILLQVAGNATLVVENHDGHLNQLRFRRYSRVEPELCGRKRTKGEQAWTQKEKEQKCGTSFSRHWNPAIAGELTFNPRACQY